MRNSQISKLNGIKKEDIERKILERFPTLNDNHQFHNMFCSYDFHENEKSLVEFWKDVIEFLFESVKCTHAMKLEEFIEYTKIRGKKPLGLTNITHKLIADGELIPSSLLTNDDYYKKYFNEIVPVKETWGKWIKNSISNYFYKEQQYTPKSNEILLDKKLFLEYNGEIIRLLEDLYHDEDLETLTLGELKQLLRKNDLDDTLLDYSITFLQKAKKISKFIVKIEGNEIMCIKFLKDEKACVSMKDSAIVNLTLSIKKLDRTLSELQNRIDETKDKAKEYMLKKDKQQASNVLKKKIVLQKSHDHFFNLKLSLEQNLLDIKSMESNQNIHNVLVESSKATQSLKVNIDELGNVADKVRDNVENLREVNDVIGDFNNEVLNNEDLEKELNDLQIAEDKNRERDKLRFKEEEEKRLSLQDNMGVSKLFPAVNKIMNNEIQMNNKEKENFINDNSFQEILEELNKK